MGGKGDGDDLTVSNVQSIERAFSILRALAVGPAGVSELATMVNLPKSTVARMLSTLEAVGAVDRMEDSSDYRIGMGIAELAGSLDASATLTVAAKPHLSRLAHQLGEAAAFSVPVGYTVHYLVQAEGPNPVQVRDYSGLVLPMHVGPAGLCMMAHWPIEDVRRYLSRKLEAFTRHTVVEPDQILERLEEIRQNGYYWINEEFAEGITSVAAPVFDTRKHILGAVSVHGPTYRFPAKGRAERIAQSVVDAAGRLSSRNG